MAKIYDSVTQLIGKTPLLNLKGFCVKNQLCATVYGKLEYFNPAGSAKDRIAAEMIEEAERKELISEGSVIIEPTSGNTGIGLAAVAAAKGYKTIFTMPETMSVERRKLLSAYGAEVVLTPAADGMNGAIQKAYELAAALPKVYIPGQFENRANPVAHFKTTGPEILEDTDGEVDILICAVGTGGTITGTGAFLKNALPELKVIAVEPENSPVLTKGEAGSHKIQGIGAGFVPKTLDTDIYDEIICIGDDEAYTTARELPQTDGVLVGISSGAALAAAKIVAKRPENSGKKIVVVLPDSGERYLSTENLF